MSYDALYERFDSPLMRQLRREAYGEDIGQHSWTSAREIEEDIARLQLTPQSRLLDFGCGPGGPLTLLAARTGCSAKGIDVSSPAIASAQARANAMGLKDRIELRVGDADAPLPFAAGAFTAAIAIDVVLHLRDRAAAFREVGRVLVPSGRFLFTDAGVRTGAASNEEIERRSVNGFTQLLPPGTNERALEASGFRLLETADRTPGLLAAAGGRLASRARHHAELERVEGVAAQAVLTRYLETVIALGERGAVTRWMFLAERR